VKKPKGVAKKDGTHSSAKSSAKTVEKGVGKKVEHPTYMEMIVKTLMTLASKSVSRTFSAPWSIIKKEMLSSYNIPELKQGILACKKALEKLIASNIINSVNSRGGLAGRYHLIAKSKKKPLTKVRAKLASNLPKKSATKGKKSEHDAGKPVSKTIKKKDPVGVKPASKMAKSDNAKPVSKTIKKKDLVGVKPASKAVKSASAMLGSKATKKNSTGAKPIVSKAPKAVPSKSSKAVASKTPKAAAKKADVATSKLASVKTVDKVVKPTKSVKKTISAKQA